jgi:hypothetical protein
LKQKSLIMQEGNTANNQSLYRAGGIAAIAGAVTMFIGAALWGSTGTDLWQALENDNLAEYLTAVGSVKSQLVANLSFWIIGVLILGLSGLILVRLSENNWVPAQAARVCYTAAVPLAIVSFIAMMSLVVQIAPDTSPVAVQLAEVTGWIGARADDLATALIVGFGPLFLAMAAKSGWMPGWLMRWGYLAGIAGTFSILTTYLQGMSAFGFIIVPIGLGWMIAAGVVLLRRAGSE